MASTGCVLAAVVCVLVSSQYAQGAVHTYKDTGFFVTADAWLYRGGREGLFASTPEAVAHWSTIAKGIATGKSYVRFTNLKFSRSESEAAEHSPTAGPTGLVQALMFDVGDRNRVGYTAPTQARYFCCSQELVRKTGCTQGKIIVSPVDGDQQWPRVVDIYFQGNSTHAEASQVEIPITKTGMYYLWYVICDKTLAGVTVSGSTVWKNPGGYLPGMMAPFMTFYGLMSLAYLALGLLWFLQYVRFWRDILQLQNCITAVLFLGMSEMATWYFDFVNFNATGFRPYGITVWAVTLGAVRKTVSRMLILVVSMGFGVVRPTLGGLTRLVLALGGVYFLATESLDIMQHVGAIDDLSSSERVLLVLPVAVLDAVFILWIFTALSKTLALLQVKKTTHKLELYRKFTNALALSVVVSVAWIGYEMYFKVSDQFNERWQSDWITSAFWHILTFVLLSVICILWAPSQNATRYAFSEDQGEDADEETIALTSTSAAAPAAAAASTDSSKPAADKKVNTDVFSLDDDVEEGKLE
eukprot:TRINITY_DN23798_c0_g1_i1.p1 TRINITY_DN23798_c0_g1~~TRINITY_DN23798_c0_g1_i1.p1  ORF type:complete len:527 (-),score=95.10 TRINITY_DN23798_c0_g1_i1:937-2517(-)